MADVRNIREFACVSVPEEIEYPLATFSSLREIIREVLCGEMQLGIVGKFDMPGPIFDRVQNALPGVVIVEADSILQDLRLLRKGFEIPRRRDYLNPQVENAIGERVAFLERTADFRRIELFWTFTIEPEASCW